MKKLDKLAGLVVLIIGIAFFAGFVKADNVSTSVTVGNAAPSITNLSLNYGNSITLLESSSQWATVTMTVTDNNGCSTINLVDAQIYLASTSNSSSTVTCNPSTQDDNNCYLDTLACAATTTVGQNVCSGALDVSAQYECGFKLWYIAEGTDSNGDWASSIWSAMATASDGISTTTATNTSEAIEVNALRALDAGPAIAYGTLSIGGTSGEQTTTATSTGNVKIDVSLQASGDMTDGGSNYILSTQQEYSLTQGFSYGAGTDLASTSAANVDTTLTNPTATTSDPTDLVYWLLQIPSGTTNANYTGTNVFTAIAPI